MVRRGRLLAVAAVAALSLLPGAARAEPTELRVAGQYGLSFLPLLIMQDQRLVEKHAQALGLPDLKVAWTQLGGINAINDALLAGKLDFAAGGVPSLVTLWSKTRGTPQEVRGAAALNDMPNELVVGRPEVKSIRDLGPQDKIAVTAVKISNQALALQMAAAREFGPENYQKLDALTVGMSHPDATLAMLSGSGAVTAHFAAPPFLERELARPQFHSILSTYDVLGGPATLNAVWTLARFRSENPKAYRAFVEALEEATAQINRDKKAAATAYRKLSHGAESQAEIEQVLADPRMVFTLTPHRVLQTAAFLHRTGRIKHAPSSWKDLFFENVHGLDGGS